MRVGLRADWRRWRASNVAAWCRNSGHTDEALLFFLKRNDVQGDVLAQASVGEMLEAYRLADKEAGEHVPHMRHLVSFVRGINQLKDEMELARRGAHTFVPFSRWLL